MAQPLHWHHVVIKGIHYPQREKNNYGDNGKSGHKKRKIPKRSFLVPDIKEKQTLDNGLNGREKKNGLNGHLILEMEKIGMHDDVIRCDG